MARDNLKALTLVIVLVAGILVVARLDRPQQSLPEYMSYPVCASEDQDTGPCYWDADVRGNGLGHSFYVTADGDVTYID